VAYLAALSTSTDTAATNVHVVGLEGIRVALEEFMDEHPQLGIRKVVVEDDAQEQPPTSTTGDEKSTVPTMATSTTTTTSPASSWERFEGDNVSLWKGDYFDLLGLSSKTDDDDDDAAKTTLVKPPPFVGTFDAVYDRASIVAIEPGLRTSYVKILDRLLRPGGRILMVALERKSKSSVEATKKGPPYSIPEETVRSLFADPGNNSSYSVTLLDQTDQLVVNPSDKERYPDLDQLLETVYLIQKEPGN